MDVDYNHNSNDAVQHGYTKDISSSTTPVKLCDIKTFIQMDATALNNNNSPTAQRFPQNGQIGSPHCKQDLQNILLGQSGPNSHPESIDDSASNVSSTQQVQDYDISNDLDDIDKTITEFSQQEGELGLNDFGNQVVPGGYSFGYDDSGSNNSGSPLLEQQLLNQITSQQNPSQQFTFMQQLEGNLNHHQKEGHNVGQNSGVKIEPNSVNESAYSGQRSPSNQLVQVNFNSNNNRAAAANTQPYLNFTVKNEHSNLFHHFKLTKEKGSSKRQAKANNQQAVLQSPVQQLPPDSNNLNEVEEEMDFNPEILEGVEEETSGVTKPGGYACRYCGKVYNSYQYRWCHERAHVAPKNHSCEICGATFQYLQNLSRHIRQVHKTTRPFKCKECGRCCSNEAELAEHALTAHENVEKGKKKETVICPVCGVEYSKKYYIRVHKKFHRGIRYSCQICGRVFTHPQNMWRHYKLHENPEAYKIGCTMCSMFFKSELTLKRHVEAKHSKHSQPSETDSTAAATTASPVPQGHPLTSSPATGKSDKDKQFHCDVCSKSFASKSALYCHFRVHQKNKTVRLYNLHCGVCKKEYKEWGALKKHCEINHNGEGLEENTLKTPVNLKSPYTEVIQTALTAGNGNAGSNITHIQQTQAANVMQAVKNSAANINTNNDDFSAVYGKVQLLNGYTYPVTTNQQEVSDYSQQQSITSLPNLSTPVKTQQQMPSSPIPNNYISSPLVNKHMMNIAEQQSMTSQVKNMQEHRVLSNGLSGSNNETPSYIDLPVSSPSASMVVQNNNPPPSYAASTTIDPTLFASNNNYSTSVNNGNVLQSQYAAIRTPSPPQSNVVVSTQGTIPSIQGIFLQSTPTHTSIPTTPTNTANYQPFDTTANLINNNMSSQGAVSVGSPGPNSSELQYLHQQQLMNSPIEEAFSPQMVGSPDTDSKRKAGRPKGAKNRKRVVINGNTFFQCHFCDALFKSRGGIRNHERMHKELNITGPLPGKNKGRVQAQSQAPSQAASQSNPLSVESEYQQALQDIFSSQSQDMANDQTNLIMQGQGQHLTYNPTSLALQGDLAVCGSDSAQQNSALLTFAAQSQQNVQNLQVQQTLQNQEIPNPQLSNNNPVQSSVLSCPQCAQTFTDALMYQQHFLLHLQELNLVKETPISTTIAQSPLAELLKQPLVKDEPPMYSVKNEAPLFSPESAHNVNNTSADVKPVISAIMSMANIMNPLEGVQNNNIQTANLINEQYINQQKVAASNNAAPEKDIKSLLTALVTLANNLNPALLKNVTNSMVPPPAYEEKKPNSAQLPSLDTLLKTPLLNQHNVNLSGSMIPGHSLSSSSGNSLSTIQQSDIEMNNS